MQRHDKKLIDNVPEKRNNNSTFPTLLLNCVPVVTIQLFTIVVIAVAGFRFFQIFLRLFEYSSRQILYFILNSQFGVLISSFST
jgi:hypothetical protein